MPTKEMFSTNWIEQLFLRIYPHLYKDEKEVFAFLFLASPKGEPFSFFDTFHWTKGAITYSAMMHSESPKDFEEKMVKKAIAHISSWWYPLKKEEVSWKLLYDKFKVYDPTSLADYAELTKTYVNESHYKDDYPDGVTYDIRSDLPMIYPDCCLANLPKDIRCDWLKKAENVVNHLDSLNVLKESKSSIESKERISQIRESIEQLKITTPTFKHDCDNCKFLGRLQRDSELYDLYYCPQKRSQVTILSRYGDNGEEYKSLDFEFISSRSHFSLFEAKNRYLGL